MRPMALFQNINNVLVEMEPKLNFKRRRIVPTAISMR
jgi:hypothetical protein